MTASPNSMGFEAKVRHVGADVVVAVQGEIDIVSADAFWNHVQLALDQASDRVVIDLSQTTFIDSTGLAVIVRAHRQLGEQADRITIRSASPTARKLFSITGIDQVVNVEAGEESEEPAEGQDANR